MTFTCGNCAKEYASFSDVLGCFLRHAAAGEYVKDWIEVPSNLMEGK